MFTDLAIPTRQAYRKIQKLMGNRFELTAVAEEEELAMAWIDAGVEEIRRIERLLTTFSDDSQTALVNRLAGIAPVEVDREMFELVERSLKISCLTQGAFDITYGSIDKRFWNFDTTMTELPDKAAARQAVRLINYRNVILDRRAGTIFLKEKGMRIGFGGIGKGYAADRAKAVMQSLGCSAGVVNASGDLAAWGRPPGGDRWTVGIADPYTKIDAFSSLSIGDLAVATSGNYEKFVEIGSRRYSHTIDPRTGYPVHGIKSVTIVTASAELADAMATPVMVMGIRAGLHLVNQLRHMACIIVAEDDTLHTSRNIQLS
jgi:thiamine biosynthesis lipoprotein